MRSENAPKDLSDYWVAALFWAVAALFLFPWSVSLLAAFHAAIAPQSAAAVWAPWWNPNHPLAMMYWGLVIMAAFLALRAWLRARGLWGSIAVAGDFSAKTIPLIAGLVIVDFIVSGFIGSAAQMLTGQSDLPAYRPGYEYAVTSQNIAGDLFSGVIAAPLFEEFAFRGLFLGCLLARGWSAWSAVVVTSAVFGLTHIQYYPSGMIMVMASGAIFGFLRIVTGGLLAPVLAHGALNFSISMLELLTPTSP